MTVIITNAEVGGVAACTVTVDHAQVTVFAPGHPDTPSPQHPQYPHETVDARGAAVVPGLWDHHVHLRALVAHSRSLDVSAAHDRAAFAALLSTAEPDESGWIRAVAYDDERMGTLTGDDLDRFDQRGIPTRVQHRSGHHWLVNRAARDLLASASHASKPTVSPEGFVWGELSVAPPGSPGAGAAGDAARFARVASQFNAYGVTGVTDLTHTNTRASVAALRGEVGADPHLSMLTLEAYGGAPEAGIAGVKLIAADHRFPDPDELVQQVRRARPLPVAIHSVTTETLAVVAWALSDSGLPGDRIEHAFLAPPELREVCAVTGAAVGAHPGFLRTHGDRVVRQCTPEEVANYQPLAAWQALGVPLLGGTDAPYSVVNPWEAMHAAVDRTTADGRVLGPEWALTPEAAFALFTKTGLRPGAGGVTVPRVSTGDAPFVAVLDRPWGAARTGLASVGVRGTVTNGRFSPAGD